MLSTRLINPTVDTPLRVHLADASAALKMPTKLPILFLRAADGFHRECPRERSMCGHEREAGRQVDVRADGACYWRCAMHLYVLDRKWEPRKERETAGVPMRSMRAWRGPTYPTTPSYGWAAPPVAGSACATVPCSPLHRSFVYPAMLLPARSHPKTKPALFSFHFLGMMCYVRAHMHRPLYISFRCSPRCCIHHSNKEYIQALSKS
ncbi:hypothetical protein EE612_018824 [Oryza sativa]|nr:hypothetical protein EE612_018824 [Oryza sativa]KAF2940170.1 hypothetical protein DAI22_03g251100 [Oryza sativa Japonica Group]